MRVLSYVSRVSALAAGLCLVTIAGIVLAQIGVRLIGFSLPSTDDFAAWAMGGAVFLALPTAFFHGKHIRVTLVTDRLSQRYYGQVTQIMNFATLGVMTAATWYGAVFVYESYILGDKSQGVIAVSLWIPQTMMLAGLVLSLPVLAALVWTKADTLAGSDNMMDTPND